MGRAEYVKPAGRKPLEYQGEPLPWYMTPGPALEASRGDFPSLLLLGGPWDLVTTYNWAYKPTYNHPKWAYRGYPNHK